MIERGKAILRRAQVTRATIYGIVGAGWKFVTGPVTAMLIATFFTPAVQGYYYTFSSVLALQIFFELGFSNIVRYFAGHEWAKLSLDLKGRIVGDGDAFSRLVSLGQASFRWYLMGGGIIALGVGIGGYIFFSRSPTDVAWLVPWFALSVLSGIQITLTPVWSLLEGCNQIAHVYFFRLVSTVFVTPAMWISIYIGAGLWSAPIATAITLVLSAVFLFRRYRRFFRPFFSPPTGPCVSWWGEIWPVQSRTAMSYVNTYFISSIFTPILFYFHGPVVAGQFGMSWSLAGAVGGIAGMWSTPRGPQFAAMIAQREYKELDKLLYRISMVAIAVLLLGGLSVWLLVYGLNVINHRFAARLLSPLPMALLLSGMVVANVQNTASVYLRAHKKEPYVAISFAEGVLTSLFALVLGSQFGALGVAVTYLGVNLILFPWGVAIFYRCRRIWHERIEY